MRTLHRSTFLSQQQTSPIVGTCCDPEAEEHNVLKKYVRGEKTFQEFLKGARQIATGSGELVGL
ncbi:hypothetical protein [Planctomicrobium sp. SH664]|uniref:hypothetical protein n=1 Tax=Planctomicrobium sp. SH664 TaxID=3448125 RepID=UPI003F5C2A5C